MRSAGREHFDELAVDFVASEWPENPLKNPEPVEGHEH